MKSVFGSAAFLTLFPLSLQSAISIPRQELPKLEQRQNSKCNVSFARMSRQESGSLLGTVSHDVGLFSRKAFLGVQNTILKSV